MVVNLTKNDLNVHCDDGVRVIVTSGVEARIAEVNTSVPTISGFEVVTTEYGEVTGLPGPAEGKIYVVSEMVAAAMPRHDVYSPGPPVRDEKGRVVGSRGLRASVTPKWGCLEKEEYEVLNKVGVLQHESGEYEDLEGDRWVLCWCLVNNSHRC